MPTRLIEALCVLGTIAVFPACGPGNAARDSAPGPSPTAATPGQAKVPKPRELSADQPVGSTESAAALTRVEDTSSVCMVNNQYMGRPQIPVVVEGQTYFGCCEMCKGRLEQDRTARFATDPVSGRPVDKATAIIGRDASNRVLYFESVATYQKYAGT